MAKFSFVLFAYVSWVLNVSVCIAPTSVHVVLGSPFKGFTPQLCPYVPGSAPLCVQISSSAGQNADSDPEGEVRPRLWGAAGGLETNNAH